MKTQHTPGPCGCCLVPVNDETEACDLCSEATGANNGIGWRIQYCPTHAAAPDLLAALQNLCGDKYLADPINADRMAEAKAAVLKARGTP